MSGNTQVQLSANSTNPYVVEINEELQCNINKLYTTLSTFVDEAKQQQKPLVVLIGEKHSSLQSLFFKNLLIDMGYALGITNVGYETTENNLTNHYNKYNYGQYFIMDMSPTLETKIKDWLFSSTSSINLVNQHGMTLMAMDDPSTDSKTKTENTSSEGVKERNNYMAKKLLSLSNNSLAVVGNAHLEGMYKQLQEDCLVLAINTDYSLDRLCGEQFFDFFVPEIRIWDKLQDNNYGLKISHKYKQQIKDLLSYFPSEIFFHATTRESLSTRAAMAIPRTLLLSFNSITNKLIGNNDMQQNSRNSI
jgi:hypothetical protein